MDPILDVFNLETVQTDRLVLVVDNRAVVGAACIYGCDLSCHIRYSIFDRQTMSFDADRLTAAVREVAVAATDAKNALYSAHHMLLRVYREVKKTEGSCQQQYILDMISDFLVKEGFEEDGGNNGTKL